MNRTYHQELLDQAMQGNAEALGTLLENYRAYLTVLAQRYLDPRLNGRLDPADVVQITFLEAQRDLASFRGHQIEELLGWLRNILRKQCFLSPPTASVRSKKISRSRSFQ